MNDSTCSRLAFTVGSSDLKGSDFNCGMQHTDEVNDWLKAEKNRVTTA